MEILNLDTRAAFGFGMMGLNGPAFEYAKQMRREKYEKERSELIDRKQVEDRSRLRSLLEPVAAKWDLSFAQLLQKVVEIWPKDAEVDSLFKIVEGCRSGHLWGSTKCSRCGEPRREAQVSQNLIDRHGALTRLVATGGPTARWLVQYENAPDLAMGMSSAEGSVTILSTADPTHFDLTFYSHSQVIEFFAAAGVDTACKEIDLFGLRPGEWLELNNGKTILRPPPPPPNDDIYDDDAYAEAEGNSNKALFYKGLNSGEFPSRG